MATLNQNIFANVTDTVIKNFEGGYYHPDMKLRMSAANAKKMGDSGETMFGIDRKHGAQLQKLYPVAWNNFWGTIDKAGARTKWKQYYRGGILEAPLTALATQMMFPWFTYLFSKYLSPAAQNIVAEDARLLMHFSYASWNGEGWFKKFATSFNNNVARGSGIDNLVAGAIKDRTGSANSLIRQSGDKMAKLIAAMSSEKKK